MPRSVGVMTLHPLKPSERDLRLLRKEMRVTAARLKQAARTLRSQGPVMRSAAPPLRLLRGGRWPRGEGCV